MSLLIVSNFIHVCLFFSFFCFFKDIKQTRADGQMPTHVEQLMIECWAHAPDTRPSFEEVARRMV
jgi:hypothetical protein